MRRLLRNSVLLVLWAGACDVIRHLSSVEGGVCMFPSHQCSQHVVREASVVACSCRHLLTPASHERDPNRVCLVRVEFFTTSPKELRCARFKNSNSFKFASVELFSRPLHMY
ncbi:hypothetical protein X975_26166, partial [Stegodyphus mimosarum]